MTIIEIDKKKNTALFFDREETLTKTKKKKREPKLHLHHALPWKKVHNFKNTKEKLHAPP
jgi:hypothetical protein